MLRRSQREGRGRAPPRLVEDAASEDATVGEQVTQIMDGGRRSRSVEWNGVGRADVSGRS